MTFEGTDCHDQFANWSRNDSFFQGVRYKTGRVVREADPYACVTRGTVRRADVGIGPYGVDGGFLRTACGAFVFSLYTNSALCLL